MWSDDLQTRYTKLERKFMSDKKDLIKLRTILENLLTIEIFALLLQRRTHPDRARL